LVHTTIAAICTGDRATIESVLPYSSDPNHFDAAIATLAAFGADAVPELLQLYHRGERGSRLQLIEYLSEIEPPRADFVSLFTEALTDSDEDIVRHAARGLGDIGPGAESAVPVLIQQYRANRQRAGLNCALAGIGPAALLPGTGRFR